MISKRSHSDENSIRAALYAFHNNSECQLQLYSAEVCYSVTMSVVSHAIQTNTEATTSIQHAHNLSRSMSINRALACDSTTFPCTVLHTDTSDVYSIIATFVQIRCHSHAHTLSHQNKNTNSNAGFLFSFLVDSFVVRRV